MLEPWPVRMMARHLVCSVLLMFLSFGGVPAFCVQAKAMSLLVLPLSFHGFKIQASR